MAVRLRLVIAPNEVSLKEARSPCTGLHYLILAVFVVPALLSCHRHINLSNKDTYIDT